MKVSTDHNLARCFHNTPSAPPRLQQLALTSYLSSVFLKFILSEGLFDFLLVTFSRPECKVKLFSVILAWYVLIYQGRNWNWDTTFILSLQSLALKILALNQHWDSDWFLVSHTSLFQVVCAVSSVGGNKSSWWFNNITPFRLIYNWITYQQIHISVEMKIAKY